MSIANFEKIKLAFEVMYKIGSYEIAGFILELKFILIKFIIIFKTNIKYFLNRNFINLIFFFIDIFYIFYLKTIY